jgi:hypothetical protein
MRMPFDLHLSADRLGFFDSVSRFAAHSAQNDTSILNDTSL